VTFKDTDGKTKTHTYTFTYVTTDSGATWNGARLSGATFYTATEGIALGPWNDKSQRYLMQTVDGGKTWTTKEVLRVAWPDARLDYSTKSLGWAVVRSYNSTRNVWGFVLVRTADSGDSWLGINVSLP
jgi:hypothetical protein